MRAKMLMGSLLVLGTAAGLWYLQRRRRRGNIERTKSMAMGGTKRAAELATNRIERTARRMERLRDAVGLGKGRR